MICADWLCLYTSKTDNMYVKRFGGRNDKKYVKSKPPPSSYKGSVLAVIIVVWQELTKHSNNSHHAWV
jgi:hypothetical protein